MRDETYETIHHWKRAKSFAGAVDSPYYGPCRWANDAAGI